jgi:predicted AAA+ superfamily ATPase
MDMQRDLENKINHLLEMFPIVAVIGPRQCGKSTIVRRLRPEWKYYDLESPDDYQLVSSDSVAFFAINQENIIIDEAQQYPDLFKTFRGVIDAARKKKGRFLLTGSSSPEIVREITESLAGRIATVELWPFKQNEFYESPLPAIYEMIIDEKIRPADFLELRPSLQIGQSLDVWFKGGFPEPLIESVANKDFYQQWMENYVIDYVTRDIRALFPRLNIHNFRRFLLLLAQFSSAYRLSKIIWTSFTRHSCGETCRLLQKIGSKKCKRQKKDFFAIRGYSIIFLKLPTWTGCFFIRWPVSHLKVL